MKLPRLRLAFSLRTSLVLLTIICLALAAFAYWLASVKRQKDAVAHLTMHGYRASYDFNYSYLPGSTARPPNPPGPVLVREYFGVDAVAGVTYVSDFNGLMPASHLQAHEIVSALRAFPRLRELSLYFTDCGDEDLREIGRNTSLTKLHVRGKALSDSGVAQLERLQQLQDVSLGSPQLTDATLTSLSQIETLVCIGLTEASLTETGLTEIVRLPRLRGLRLDGVTIGPAAQAHFPALENVTYVQLAKCRGVTDDTFELIARMPALENLAVPEHHSSQLSDRSLRALAQAARLKELEFQSTNITNAGLLELTQIKSLRNLRLGSSKISGEGVDEFRRIRPDVVTDITVPEFAPWVEERRKRP